MHFLQRMGYYLYWIFFVHGFTAFLIDYLLIGTFSYSESSFSYMVFNQNLYLTSFSILLFLSVLIVVVGIISLSFMSNDNNSVTNIFSLTYYFFSWISSVEKLFSTALLKWFGYIPVTNIFSFCEWRGLNTLHSAFSFCSGNNSSLAIKNIFWSFMNNLLFFGFIFDSSSSYSQTFFKYFFLIWNSFFWTKGFIVLIEYWTGLYLSSHKLYHLIYNSSFQFSFIFLFLLLFLFS